MKYQNTLLPLAILSLTTIIGNTLGHDIQDALVDQDLLDDYLPTTVNDSSILDIILSKSSLITLLWIYKWHIIASTMFVLFIIVHIVGTIYNNGYNTSLLLAGKSILEHHYEKVGVQSGKYTPDETTGITYESNTAANILALSPIAIPGQVVPVERLGLGCSIFTSLKFRAELISLWTKYIDLAPKIDSLSIEFALPAGILPPAVYLLARNNEKSSFTRFFGYEDIELFGKIDRPYTHADTEQTTFLETHADSISSSYSTSIDIKKPISLQYSVITDIPSLYDNPPLDNEFINQLFLHPKLVKYGISLRFIYISDQHRRPLPIENASGVVRFVFELPDYISYDRNVENAMRDLYILVIGIMFPRIASFQLNTVDYAKGTKLRQDIIDAREEEDRMEALSEERYEKKKEKERLQQEKEEKKYLAQKEKEEKSKASRLTKRAKPSKI